MKFYIYKIFVIHIIIIYMIKRFQALFKDYKGMRNLLQVLFNIFKALSVLRNSHDSDICVIFKHLYYGSP